MVETNVIETRGLTKYFGRKCVVDSLSLAIPRGSVFAFLGRNGSGKTTTIRMLLGLLPPTRGSATILGHDITAIPPAARARIGYLAEGHELYPWMRVGEVARFQAAFYEKWNRALFDSAIAHFALSPRARVRDLSRGERAGLCLALTLAPNPDLLILDDPALGLDPVARRSLLESFLFVTRRAEATILFSSHILADVERVADHIAILDRSILRAACPIETFRSAVTRYALTFEHSPPPLPVLPRLLEAIRRDNTLQVTLANPDVETVAELHAMHPVSLEAVPLSLEDALTTYMSDNRQGGFLQHDVGVHA